jgi:hypothetical protein
MAPVLARALSPVLAPALSLQFLVARASGVRHETRRESGASADAPELPVRDCLVACRWERDTPARVDRGFCRRGTPSTEFELNVVWIAKRRDRQLRDASHCERHADIAKVCVPGKHRVLVSNIEAEMIESDAMFIERRIALAVVLAQPDPRSFRTRMCEHCALGADAVVAVPSPRRRCGRSTARRRVGRSTARVTRAPWRRVRRR